MVGSIFFLTIRGFGRLDWFEMLDPVKDIQAQITVDLLGVIWTAACRFASNVSAG